MGPIVVPLGKAAARTRWRVRRQFPYLVCLPFRCDPQERDRCGCEYPRVAQPEIGDSIVINIKRTNPMFRTIFTIAGGGVDDLGFRRRVPNTAPPAPAAVAATVYALRRRSDGKEKAVVCCFIATPSRQAQFADKPRSAPIVCSRQSIVNTGFLVRADNRLRSRNGPFKDRDTAWIGRSSPSVTAMKMASLRTKRNQRPYEQLAIFNAASVLGCGTQRLLQNPNCTH